MRAGCFAAVHAFIASRRRRESDKSNAGGTAGCLCAAISSAFSTVLSFSGGTRRAMSEAMNEWIGWKSGPQPLQRRGNTPLRAGIVVVGSGPGGAVTACTLAEAGRDVLLVEEGPFLPLESCSPFSVEI